jgi:N-glycosylase/DNA lyase
MSATVTLPLKDFDELREQSDKAEQLIKSTKKAALEIEVFLSFLITRENISEYLEEFNRQATGAEILLIDGRAKIKFNENN